MFDLSTVTAARIIEGSGLSIEMGASGAFVPLGHPSYASLVDELKRAGFLVVSLDDNKLEATRKINAAAENARAKYLTPGVGQALTYMAKVDELRRYDADSNPVKADYPFLSAEIGITAPSLSGVADVVRAARSAWETVGVEIESTRLKAKQAISKAETPSKIDAIVSAIEWP